MASVTEWFWVASVTEWFWVASVTGRWVQPRASDIGDGRLLSVQSTASAVYSVGGKPYFVPRYAVLTSSDTDTRDRGKLWVSQRIWGKRR